MPQLIIIMMMTMTMMNVRRNIRQKEVVQLLFTINEKVSFVKTGYTH